MAAVIGTGIFLSPRGVVSNAGSIGATMAIWAVCGITNTVMAISFFELVGMIPKVNIMLKLIFININRRWTYQH